MFEQLALEHRLSLFKGLALASLSSLTSRSWKVPHSLSIVPLTLRGAGKIGVCPSSSRALPTSVRGRLLTNCSPMVGSRSVQSTEC
jgi:hypothetical protein